MKITNTLNLPEGIVRAISTEPHNKSDMELSATTLLKGTKEIILTNRHWDELTDDAADRIWAIWGQAVHALLEVEGKNEFTEIDLTAKIGDMTVTGRIDNYDMEAGIITDYKTASVYKVMLGDSKDWWTQGVIYAWLLAKNNFKTEKCRFIGLLKDHSKSKAKLDHSYPQSPVYIYEFPVTKADLVCMEEYLKDRLGEYLKYKDAADDDIPPCTDDERWASETKYAVMKTGRKSAIRLLDSITEANKMAAELGTGHSVVTRPGVSRKCADYCVCRNFCNFYNNIVKLQESGE